MTKKKDSNTSIGERIRQKRKQQNTKQWQLAEKLNIPVSSLSAYECDHVDMKASVICEIAEALGVSPGYLIGDDVNENSSLVYIKDEEVRQQLEVLIYILIRKGI